MNRKRKLVFVLACSLCMLSVFLSSGCICYASVWAGNKYYAVNPLSYISYSTPSGYSDYPTTLVYTPEPFFNDDDGIASFMQVYETGNDTSLRSGLQYEAYLNDGAVTYEYTSLPLSVGGWWESVRKYYSPYYPTLSNPSTDATYFRAPILTDTLTYHFNEYYVDVLTSYQSDARIGLYYHFDYVVPENARERYVDDIFYGTTSTLTFEYLNGDTGTWLTKTNTNPWYNFPSYDWIVSGDTSTLVMYPQVRICDELRETLSNMSSAYNNGQTYRLRNVDLTFTFDNSYVQPHVINQFKCALSIDSPLPMYADTYVDSVSNIDFDELDLTSWLGNSIQGFINAEIFPYVAVGGVVGLCITISIAIAILKIFAGG